AGEADALVEMHQVRRGVDMDLEPLCLQHRAREGTGRTLAVGAGDMDDRRQPVLRIAKVGEKTLDAVENEIDPLRRKGRKPFEDRVALGGAEAHGARAGSTAVRASTVRVCGGGSFAFGRERRISRCTRREITVRSSWRCTTMSIMPCSSRYSARWKPSGR